MAPQAAQGGPTAPSGASLVAEPQNKGGRPRGLGKVPGSGRRKGVPNKLGREAREYLASHSDYLKTICALAKGKPIKFAARRGHKPTWHQPDWPDVKWALETIVNKLVPTVAQSEITGADGAAFMPEPISRERTMLETARAVGFLMSLGEQDAGEPSPVSSLRKPETPAPVGKVSDLPFTKDAKPEAEQTGPSAPAPRVEPGSIYTEYQEPLDPELVGKVIIARVRNGRWAALHADTRQPIDPTMGEPAAHIAEAKAKAILATTTAKGGGGGKKSAG